MGVSWDKVSRGWALKFTWLKDLESSYPEKTLTPHTFYKSNLKKMALTFILTHQLQVLN